MLFKGSKGVHLRPIKFGGLFIVAERESERAWHAEADKTVKAYL